MNEETAERKNKMQLYDTDKLKAAGDEITAMAERFAIAREDVIYASWVISKDMVWAKLERDLEWRLERKGGSR